MRIRDELVHPAAPRTMGRRFPMPSLRGAAHRPRAPPASLREITMRKLVALLLGLVLLPALIFGGPAQKKEDPPGRWPPDRANAWYEKQPWLVGANFIPSTAINQREMWQADTFDPKTIDRELGWAAGLGMNTMRVFLHDLAWESDPAGFKKRVGEYLAIADRHGIRT